MLLGMACQGVVPAYNPVIIRRAGGEYYVGRYRGAHDNEIIPAVRALSRGEKFQLAQMLLADLATEELHTMFKEGQVFPIYTPEYAPEAAAQLAKLLMEEGTRS